MAKLNKLFEEFLHNIEPSNKSVDYAKKANEPVRQHLETDEDFKEYFEGSFLYGSYKRHTAVGDIKDVDIVILTNFDPESEDHTPQKVLKKLKDVLAKYYDDPDNPEYQRRSIRINEPLPDSDIEMTLDIIPAVSLGDGSDTLLVPDRESKEWVYTNPQGHIDYVHELNSEDHSGGTFVPLAKLMKWWWKYQCEVVQPDVLRPKPKGFWVECLTAENFNPKAETWADHFIETLENIATKYPDITEIPVLSDPGIPEQQMKTSMTQEEFGAFMEVVNNSLDLARQAYNEQDETISSELWREIFGDKFPVTTKKSLSETARNNNLIREANEQFIEDLGITRLNTSYRVVIDAKVTQDGFRPFLLSSAFVFLRKKRGLSFFIDKSRSNIPPDSTIYWKVKNKGDEAAKIGQLRGEINRDKGSWERVENTAYEGKHYVECYAVVGNSCIAVDRIDVPIGSF